MTLTFAARFKKALVLRDRSDSGEKEKDFEKDQKNLVEIIKAHTFATRSKNRAAEKAEKFFERLEAIAHKSSIYGKVVLAKNNDNMTVISRENDSQYQNSFTMESLILAQDER